jgi:hypothetical protein
LGAAFDFWIGPDGKWSAEGMKAVRLPDGRWEDIGEGGSSGDAWPTPWSPPDQGWGGRHLMVMGTVGQDVFEDDHDSALIAAYGFASRRVASIRVEADAAVRTIAPSACGGFIALAVGSGVLTVTPLDHDGRLLNDGERFG